MLVFGASEGASCSIPHDNKTGRFLPVFHATWDPKQPAAFAVGSMSKRRVVEVYSIPAGGRVAVLGGDALTSVQSRMAFHPMLDVLVCANASGRVHIFD